MARRAQSGGGGKATAVLIVLFVVVALLVSPLFRAVSANEWVKDFVAQPTKTVASTLGQANPLPRRVTVCDKTDLGGQRVILTSNREQFVIGDEVSHGLFLTGDILSGAEAYALLERGKAYELGIRSLPFVNWNTEIWFIGKPLEEPEPDTCPG